MHINYPESYEEQSPGFFLECVVSFPGQFVLSLRRRIDEITLPVKLPLQQNVRSARGLIIPTATYFQTVYNDAVPDNYGPECKDVPLIFPCFIEGQEFNQFRAHCLIRARKIVIQARDELYI